MQKLSSSIKGIETLLQSKDPIGYQQGSFAESYLIEELHIDESRLVPLVMPEDYARALKAGPHKKGGVAAVIDERAYMELFLSSRCDFSIVGQEFTKTGWGFVSLFFVYGILVRHVISPNHLSKLSIFFAELISPKYQILHSHSCHVHFKSGICKRLTSIGGHVDCFVEAVGEWGSTEDP